MILFTARLSRVAQLAALLALCGSAAAAEIYKSLDANGNVVYSDHLDSPSSEATVVNLRDSTHPLQSADAPSAPVQGGTEPPPPLPPEEQPAVPQADELWVPGYWNWQNHDYVWMPGSWVVAPRVGFLWTPPWWELVGRHYVFHAGHWGPSVGYYGGINYGYGYDGSGYCGGRWAGNHVAYNSSVTRVGPGISNQYAEPATTASPRSTASFRFAPSHASAAVTTSAAAHPPAIDTPQPVRSARAPALAPPTATSPRPAAPAAPAAPATTAAPRPPRTAPARVASPH